MGKLMFLNSNNIYKFSCMFLMLFHLALSLSSSKIKFVPGFKRFESVEPYKPYKFKVYKFSCMFLMLFHLALSFSSSKIKCVPGCKGALPFELETGYIGVDVSEDVQLFYHFIKSESNPKKYPLILWLTGGPGCSSFTRFAFEIGPLKFDTVKGIRSFPTLVLNPYSWTKVGCFGFQKPRRTCFNIIFLDLPVGTGFSYGRTSIASQSYDWQAIDQAYEFLKKWLINHPEFLSNPIYIGGDSYSGETVPRIVQLISHGTETHTKPHANLKGYLLGNPKTHPEDGNYKIPLAQEMGLISDEFYGSLQTNCQGEHINVDPDNILCLQDLQAFTEAVSVASSWQPFIEKLRILHLPVPEITTRRPFLVYWNPPDQHKWKWYH